VHQCRDADDVGQQTQTLTLRRRQWTMDDDTVAEDATVKQKTGNDAGQNGLSPPHPSNADDDDAEDDDTDADSAATVEVGNNAAALVNGEQFDSSSGGG
jgi:hypothetical protein